ncbi:MAG TPA: VCBS repeat-containing protein [Balneolaceae bacterium]|nr:VCBS repeat-containing protein [Balneolaceae bacterium]
MYNGGGVAVADFNGDGRPDLYFVGNEVSNRLYLNEGNMKFKDVTKASKTSGSNKQWYTGVSVIDINGDGRPDIYLCASRYKDPNRRKNVLLINQGVNKQGIPVFKNEASEYGLASTAYSTQGVFFENDGHLDMYEVVSDIHDKAKKKNVRQKLNKITAKKNPANIDRLYRCEENDSLGHPICKNISKQAGINKPGYGLGVHVFDINGDGRPDIYVSNDYRSNDLLWINNGDGTFTDHLNEYIKHTSFSGMGTDAGDINNDGRLDLFQVGMAGRNNYERQTMNAPDVIRNYYSSAGNSPEFTGNTLQLNQGPISRRTDSLSHPIFSEISRMAGVARTNWSWGVLLADFNNDGHKDLVISNGIPKKINDNDFLAKRGQMKSVAPQSMLLDAIPSQKVPNMAFENEGRLKFSNVTKVWGLSTPSYSTGMAWADLDNNGALDLIINNIDGKATLYKNTLDDPKKKSSHHWLEVKFKGDNYNNMGLGAKVDVYYNGTHQTCQHTPYRGYLSSVENMVHFGLGNATRIDSLVVTRLSKKGLRKQVWRNIHTDQVVTAKFSNSRLLKSNKDVKQDKPALFTDVTRQRKIQFAHNFGRKNHHNLLVMPLMLSRIWSQYGPALAAGDVNGDGLQDIFVGNTKYHKSFFLIQQPNGSFKKENLLQDPSLQTKQVEGALLFDANNDGRLDLYIVSGGVGSSPGSPNYQDRLYENEGNGQFVDLPNALPPLRESGSVVTAADYDHDGDLDLLVCGGIKPGNYPKPASCHILQNNSTKKQIKFKDVTDAVAKPLQHIGMVTDALWTDYNNDGWPDLILCGKWMPITILKNEHGKKFVNITHSSGIADKVGWWNSLVAGDFNNDGKMDYIAGNLGTNTIFKATNKRPVGIYAGDFNNNGIHDAVITHYAIGTKGKLHEYPINSFNNMVSQIPDLFKKIKNDSSYAQATIKNILSGHQLKKALKYHANDMKTSYIENHGNGKFSLHALPAQAQFAPIFGMISGDFNNDGKLDVLLSGNEYKTIIQSGSYDALNGLLLSGNGQGKFTPQSIASSGIFIPGNGKSLIKLSGAHGNYLVAAGQNKGPIKLFALHKKVKIYPVKAMDASAVIHFKDGKKRKVEFHYGSSFLSSSGRFIAVTPEMKSASITTYKGKTRTVVFTDTTSQSAVKN